MKRFLISIVLLLVSASVFAGPSAKFAATYTTDPALGSMAVVSGTEDDSSFDINAGFTLATIKVPQDKELLVGVSSEVGLLTDTSIKGKNGGTARSIAGAGAGVAVFAVPVEGPLSAASMAKPGPVALSARVQELSATLGGVIESCEDTTGGTDDAGLNPGDEGYVDTPDGVIDVLTECIVSDEEIGLMQGTLAAHHFNFVLPNMDQGEYNIVAFFLTGAYAEIDIDEASVADGGSVSAFAMGAAFVGKTMVTVQQVRATKGGVIDSEITEL